MRALVLISSLAFLSGCTTIHFDHEGAVTSNPSNQQKDWHHIMALSLVEVSDPVNLAEKCGTGGWETVQTETSFENGLIGVIPYMNMIWTPKTVTVQCRNPVSESDG